MKKIDPPKGYRGKFFMIVNHPIFENTISAVIGFNTLAMAIKFDGMPP